MKRLGWAVNVPSLMQVDNYGERIIQEAVEISVDETNVNWDAGLLVSTAKTPVLKLYLEITSMLFWHAFQTEHY